MCGRKKSLKKREFDPSCQQKKKIQLSAALRQMEGKFELAAQTLKDLHKLAHDLRLIKVSSKDDKPGISF